MESLFNKDAGIKLTFREEILKGKFHFCAVTSKTTKHHILTTS